MIVFSTSVSEIELVHPVNNSEDLNMFGLSCTFSPPEQVTQKWGYIGQNGEQIKKMGAGGQSGTVAGFVDASTEAHLNTGMQTLMAAVVAAEPETIFIGTGVSVANGILTKVAFPRMWAYGNRFCCDFVLYWEAT